MEATTVICVRHKGNVSIGGDGQVTMHATIVKHTAKKVRKLYKDRCLSGHCAEGGTYIFVMSE